MTIYATTDMIIYNRKKKAQFFEEQKVKAELAIDMARKAVQDGKATEEHIKLIKMEEEHQASLQAERLKKGIFSRGKEWLFSGLKLDEEDDTENKSLFNKKNGLTEHDKGVANVSDELSDITSNAKQAFGLEREQQKFKASLNQISTKTESGESQESKTSGWRSWILGQ